MEKLERNSGLHELEDELTRVDVPLSLRAHELYELATLHIATLINRRRKAMRPSLVEDQSAGCCRTRLDRTPKLLPPAGWEWLQPEKAEPSPAGC